MKKLSIIYWTHNDKFKAKEIVHILLSKKLIACANIFQGDSIYMWQEVLTEDREFFILCKTNLSLVDQVKQEIENLHSYAVPCVLSWEAAPSSGFAHWVLQETGILDKVSTL